MGARIRRRPTDIFHRGCYDIALITRKTCPNKREFPSVCPFTISQENVVRQGIFAVWCYVISRCSLTTLMKVLQGRLCSSLPVRQKFVTRPHTLGRPYSTMDSPTFPEASEQPIRLSNAG